MRRLRLLGLLATVLLLLAACGTEAEEVMLPEATEVSATTETAPPTETVVSATNTAIPTETVAPTETAVSPTETPAPTATAETVASACVTCHSDQEMLINTAAPVDDEPEETESSGVG